MITTKFRTYLGKVFVSHCQHSSPVEEVVSKDYTMNNVEYLTDELLESQDR